VVWLASSGWCCYESAFVAPLGVGITQGQRRGRSRPLWASLLMPLSHSDSFAWCLEAWRWVFLHWLAKEKQHETAINCYTGANRDCLWLWWDIIWYNMHIWGVCSMSKLKWVTPHAAKLKRCGEDTLRSFSWLYRIYFRSTASCAGLWSIPNPSFDNASWGKQTLKERSGIILDTATHSTTLQDITSISLLCHLSYPRFPIYIDPGHPDP
jgi:hypothetical protein